MDLTAFGPYTLNVRTNISSYGPRARLIRAYYIFIISQLCLTSHSRSTVVLLDTGTPGTSREIYSEDADSETRTRNPSVINQVL